MNATNPGMSRTPGAEANGPWESAEREMCDKMGGGYGGLLNCFLRVFGCVKCDFWDFYSYFCEKNR